MATRKVSGASKGQQFLCVDVGLIKGVWRLSNIASHGSLSEYREGANREKLTVKKLIDNEKIFFSPFISLTNRQKSA